MIGILYLWFSSLPPADCTVEVVILEAKPLGDLLIAGLLRVNVERVENCESFLRISVLGVGHPAAWLHLLLEVYIQDPSYELHLVAVQPPVLQLLLKERPAHVSGVVQLPSPVVVEDLTEDPRVPAVDNGY